MTSPSPSRATHRAAPAALGGTLAGAAVTGLGTALGVVPEGAGGYVAGGAALACLAGTLGCLLQAGLFASPAGGDRRLQAQRMQMTLGLDFAIKLGCVLIAGGILWAQGVKFEQLAAFALAFATVALVFQLVGAVVLARSASRSRREAVESSAPAAGTDRGRHATNG